MKFAIKMLTIFVAVLVGVVVVDAVVSILTRDGNDYIFTLTLMMIMLIISILNIIDFVKAVSLDDSFLLFLLLPSTLKATVVLLTMMMMMMTIVMIMI